MNYFYIVLLLSFSIFRKLLSLELTNENFDNIALNKNPKTNQISIEKNFFLIFFAEWCGHCTSLVSDVKQMEEEIKLKQKNINFSFILVNAEKNSYLSRRFMVSRYPTIFFVTKEQKMYKYLNSDRKMSTLFKFAYTEYTTEEALEFPLRVNYFKIVWEQVTLVFSLYKR